MTNHQQKYHDDGRIDSFLLGRMTDSERQAFIADLKNNEQLRLRTVAMAHLVSAMATVGKERDRTITDALLSVSRPMAADIARHAVQCGDKGAATEHTGKRHVARHILPNIISAAVIIAALWLAGIPLYRRYAVIEMADRYATVFNHSDFVRGEAQTNADTELARLYSNVVSGRQLPATTERLAVLWQLAGMDLYTDYSASAPEIGWYLAIAYMKQNDREHALSVLLDLERKSQDGSAMKTQTQKLINELHKY